MTKKPVKNISASVFQRLQNLARTRGEDVNALLIQYAIERLLFRISKSRHANQFVLKGAMLFRVWSGDLHRPTQDVDFLGFGESDPDQVKATFESILQEVDDVTDGLVFDHAAIKAFVIREGQNYRGARLRIPVTLGTARIVAKVDVGFGDAVTPEAEVHQFPTLLDHEPPCLRVYPQSTAVAEKLEAICSLGLANSRMKDYYDIVVMSRRYELDGATLTRAIVETFGRRGAVIPSSIPVGLTDAFANDADKKKQWAAYLSRTGLSEASADLKEVVVEILRFVGGPLGATAMGGAFSARWTPLAGWQADSKT